MSRGPSRSSRPPGQSPRPILDACRDWLAAFGDTPAGVGWRPEDAAARYRVMLDLVGTPPRGTPLTLLDFGCGASHLLDHMLAHGVDHVTYTGLDASPEAVALCRAKHPAVEFLQLDVLDPACPAWPDFDLIVMNGVLTYRGELTHDAMWDYTRELLRTVFPHARHGLSFNVMSPQVDWERDDLFHLPVDPLLDFVSRELSRHVRVRHDYGLYEYTVHVLREASDPTQRHLPGRVIPGSTPRPPRVTRPEGRR